MFELVKLGKHPNNLDPESIFTCDWFGASIFRHDAGYLVSSYALTKSADEGCDAILQMFTTLDEAKQAAGEVFGT